VATARQGLPGSRAAEAGREVRKVAKNTGRGYREGAVRDRSQLETPVGWTKRDSETGRFMDVKSDGEPFKGMAVSPWPPGRFGR
jgi:hypothetical protein